MRALRHASVVGLLGVSVAAFAGDEDPVAIGLGATANIHANEVEDNRASQEVRIGFYHFGGPVSIDLRAIRISREGFYDSEAAYGAGIGFRYDYWSPDSGVNTLESGPLFGVGAGIYHYFTGDSRYPVDPFVETSAGFLMSVAGGVGLLLEGSFGIYPHLAFSDYLESASLYARLRPRVSVGATLLIGF